MYSVNFRGKSLRPSAVRIAYENPKQIPTSSIAERGISQIILMMRNMLISALFFFLPVGLLGAAEIHVSPDGEVRTLQEARDQVRAMRAGGEVGDINVVIAEGTYVLSETLILGIEDSAPEGATTTYMAADGAFPLISGGVALSDWKKTNLLGGKIWKTEVPWAKGDAFFHCLYDGKTLLPRARSESFLVTAEKKDIIKYAGELDVRTEFSFPEGSLNSWSNLPDIELYGQPTRKWLVNYLELEEVNVSKGRAKLKTPATYTMSGEWYVENSIEHLDTPGEWVLNSAEGVLYYYPESGTPGENIIAPKLDELIRVEGSHDSSLAGEKDIPVTGIVFQGLTFSYADRQKWLPEDIGIQHDWNMWDKDNGLVRLRGVKNCAVRNCTFSESGSDGVRMDLYAQENSVLGCVFKNLGGSAVVACGYGPGKKDVNKKNVIHDNEIVRVGQLFLHSPGIFIWQSGHNTISHNHIHELAYTGIVVAGVRRRFFAPYYIKHGMDNPYALKWMFPEGTREHLPTIRWDEITLASNSDWNAFEPYMHARKNVIEFNEVHDCLKLLHDGNCIYLSANGEGNIVRHNVTYNHGHGAMIRTDDDSHGAIINGNLLFGTLSRSGICIKGLNESRHNILINAHFNTGRAGNSVDPASDLSQNIFYHTSPFRAKGYHYGLEKVGAGLDKNIYFSTDGRMAKILENQKKRNITKLADRASVAADPLFKDIERGDFSYKTGSPAGDLGIPALMPEKVSKMGTTRDPFMSRFKGGMPLQVVPIKSRAKKRKKNEVNELDL